MIKKLSLFFFVFFVLCPLTLTAFALPLPNGDFDRQQAIDTYFKDKPQNALEGIWVTDDNKYEIAIIKNDFEICKGYDYVGFIVESTDSGWSKGKVKFQLKTTAIPKFFVGLSHKKPDSYLTLNSEQSPGSIFRIVREHLMEFTNEKREKRLLFRIYPGNVDPANTGTRSGTGFFITPDLIVTNYHVIDSAETIEIKHNSGEKATATVIAKDPINDLALLKVNKLKAAVTPLSIETNHPSRYGDTVYTIGFPLPGLLGTKAKLSEGIINSVTGIQDDVRMFQISIPVQPGNSGGPLINARGQVVGIVTAGVDPYKSLVLTGTFPQNVNFAMKINYVNNLIDTLPEKVHLPGKQPSYIHTPAQIMTLANDAVVKIDAK